MSRSRHPILTVLRLFPTATALGLCCGLWAGGCAHDAARPATPGASPLPAWPSPSGWKSETLAFPLDFAPALVHRGSEELRFAPGFFSPTAPGYFSYAFVWWLSEREPLSTATLATELNQYYAGLCTAVGKNKFSLDPARYHVELTEAPASLPGWTTLTGKADLFDPFTTGQPLGLRLRAYQRDCPADGHRAVLVLASPQPDAAPIWTALADRAAAFHCQ